MKHLIITLLACFLALPASAAQSIGKVILSFGQNFAVSETGEQRNLKRQSDIFADDLLKTGAKGRLQIRFSDGSRLSLKPESEFRIAEYRFDEAQPDEGKAIYQLLKGGMRTISGQIGKKNRDNYEMKTAVATIGIRGTHYGVEYTNDGIYAETVAGAIAVRSDQALVTLKAGEGAQVSGITGTIEKGEATGQTGNSSEAADGGEAQQQEEESSDSAENTESEDSADAAESGDSTETASSESSSDSESNNTAVQSVADSVNTGSVVPASDQNQQSTVNDNVLAIAPDPTGNGTRSPEGSLVAVAFTNIKNGEVKGSNGAVLADGNSSITIDSNIAKDNLVTGIAYIDDNTGGEPCQPCIFTGPDTVSGITANNIEIGGARVTWGRWNRGFSVTENGVDQTLNGSFHFNACGPVNFSGATGRVESFWFLPLCVQ